MQAVVASDKDCYLDCGGPDKLCFTDTCCNNPRMKNMLHADSAAEMSSVRHRFVNMTFSNDTDQPRAVVEDTRV